MLLANQPEQVVQRERPRPDQRQRDGRDDQHEVVLVAAVLHEEPLRPVHLGDRDRHRREHQQPGHRREQPEQEEQPRQELATHGEGRPEGRRPQAEAPDESRCAGETGFIGSLGLRPAPFWTDRKSTRLNSSHLVISYAVFCLKKKNNNLDTAAITWLVDELSCFSSAVMSPTTPRILPITPLSLPGDPNG